MIKTHKVNAGCIIKLYKEGLYNDYRALQDVHRKMGNRKFKPLGLHHFISAGCMLNDVAKPYFDEVRKIELDKPLGVEMENLSLS